MMNRGMDAGAVVLLHLVEPMEKYWGVLGELGMAGVTVRAINLSSLDDWMRSLAYDEVPAINASTIFFPLRRVERMSLDEPIGEVESLSQMFERRVGRSLQEVLGLEPEDADAPN
ncbi:MAG: hypothetical protein AAF725_16840 [Acidobacteriota bacterium]